jgi:hypothetical protein
MQLAANRFSKTQGQRYAVSGLVHRRRRGGSDNGVRHKLGATDRLTSGAPFRKGETAAVRVRCFPPAPPYVYSFGVQAPTNV